MRLVTLLMLFTFTSILPSQAQEVWNLRRCIQQAQQANLSIKQAGIAVKQAKLDQKTNRLSRLPSVNGRGSAGFQFGRTIDPTTNEFNNQRIGFNSFSIDADAPIYAGGQINNSIKQSRYDVRAAIADKDDIMNNIALEVAANYLNILLAEEQLANARTRIQLSREQYAQTERLVEAGTRPRNDLLDIEAQIFRDSQVIIAQANTVTLNYLTLKQSMQVAPDLNMVIDRPEVVIPADAAPEALTLDKIYAIAYQNQPVVKASENRMKSAEVGVDVARANLLPTLSIFGSMSSNYSSVGRRVTDTRAIFSDTDVFIDNQPAVLSVPDFDFTVEDTPYFTQLDENFGQSLGLSLNVPIFNNYRNRAIVERAELGILSAQIDNERVLQQLKNDIQQALTNATAAKAQLEAAQRSVTALETTFYNAQRRYDLGAINTFELTTARNNLDQSAIDLVISKYDYLFRLKILDFYMGKTLTID